MLAKGRNRMGCDQLAGKIEHLIPNIKLSKSLKDTLNKLHSMQISTFSKNMSCSSLKGG